MLKGEDQMSVFFMVILLVTAAVVANTIYDIFPKIPLAFYQIAAGLVLSLVPAFTDFHLEPELFMLVIIAPLMFNDGQNTNYQTLRRGLRSTMSLAVLLAVVTIVIGGYFAHAVWNAIPLALAIALAAIVTPTDAVAVKSITADLEVPEPVMTSLENESLFNDASGLVALSLALAAFTTGEFSLGESFGQFLVVFFGGILMGILLGMLIVLMRVAFQRKSMNAIAVVLPVNLMTPFVVYLVAEHFGFSGILAVVAAGIVHGIQSRRLRLTSTQIQVVSHTTWNIFSSLLNGFVFVLLGTVMPQVWQNLTANDAAHMPELIIIAIGLYLLMTALRFLWASAKFVNLHSQPGQQMKDRFILAISGVHGTITLAMAFSLPLTLNGQAFPFRTALTFIAGTVIILSLVVPTLVLPLIINKKQATFTQAEFDGLLSQMVAYAVDQLKNTTENHTALASVIETLNSQKNGDDTSDERLVHQLLEKTEEVETAAIGELIEAGEIDAAIGWKYNRMQLFQLQFAFLSPIARLKMWARLVIIRLFPKYARKVLVKTMKNTAKEEMKSLRPVNQTTANLTTLKADNDQLTHQAQQLKEQLPAEIRANPFQMTRRQRREIRKKMRTPELMAQQQQVLSQMETHGYEAVMAYLDQAETPANHAEINVARHYYTVRHNRFNRSEATNEIEDQLFIQAFQYEYAFVQSLAADKEIVPDLVNELHAKISMDQLVYMQKMGA